MDNAFVITTISFLLLIAAYFTYGKFLARKIFQLDPHRETVSHTKEDGVDYIPTKKSVLFGHHFASIAGLGPILGPAVAVVWGWVPAVLWVIVGSIVMGAVHDLGAMYVSLRNDGRSIGDVCDELMGKRARLIFLFLIFFLMALAMGAFVAAISALFVAFRPDAIIPSFGLMLVAMAVGVSVYKLKYGLGPATIFGLVAFAGLIYWGVEQPLPTYMWAANAETNQILEEGMESNEFQKPYGFAAASKYVNSLEESEAKTAALANLAEANATTTLNWKYLLLAYGFLASILPVWLLLQPRDYINSFQLYFALAALFLGLVIAFVTGSDFNRIDAPTFNDSVAAAVDESAPEPTEKQAAIGEANSLKELMLPFLFVTIACGAVSGFHSIVSSGTTVRQLDKETDALPIGFGAMLTEGGLAILVIMACVAGLGAEAWGPSGTYASLKSIAGSGLGGKLNAVIEGGANFLTLLHIPVNIAMAILAVTIVAFAMTTLDSATRLLRFNVEEIFKTMKLNFLANRYVASFIAVVGIAVFALPKASTTLWILFGATNQILAGLTLLSVTLYLYKTKRSIAFTGIPMIFMMLMSVSALGILLYTFCVEQSYFEPGDTDKRLLIGFTIMVIGIAVWLMVEGLLAFKRFQKEREEPAKETPAEEVVRS